MFGEKEQDQSPRIIAVLPVRTGAVRVTGVNCPLNCAHCGGHYLKGMKPLSEVVAGAARRPRWQSLLVSGACNPGGEVPLASHLKELRQLAKSYRLNLHTGYVADETVAQRLAEVATVFSCDFVGDEATLAEVYGLPYSVHQYLASLKLLQRYGRVVPHICLGLSETRLASETHAVRLLVEAGFSEIVFLIFRPTRGTCWAGKSPPAPEEVAAFLARIREDYPQLWLTLGCMRPGGGYRQEVDSYAVTAGINAIVQPAPAALASAQKQGIEVSTFFECCSFWGGLDAD
ncbi:MAG: radical SAM protein [Firmicutes bacterium]|nr:radical SAM protein [Bacillota bacterium]